MMPKTVFFWQFHFVANVRDSFQKTTLKGWKCHSHHAMDPVLHQNQLVQTSALTDFTLGFMLQGSYNKGTLNIEERAKRSF